MEEDSELRKAKDNWYSIANSSIYSEEQKRMARDEYYELKNSRSSSSLVDDIFVKILTHPIMLCLFAIVLVVEGIKSCLAYWKENPCTGTLFFFLLIEIIVAITWIFRTFQIQERKVLMLAIGLLLWSIMIIAGCIVIQEVKNLFGLILPLGIMFWVYRKQKEIFKNVILKFREIKHEKVVISIYVGTIVFLIICFLI